MMLRKRTRPAESILNIASVSGRGGRRYLSAYSASKRDDRTIAFTKSVALEVVRSGIRVNTILPGFTDTPMTQGTPKQPRPKNQNKKFKRKRKLTKNKKGTEIRRTTD
uniref:Putative mitochondrial/plastidial beta-ketoacyl-acp reductase n=1 Tax=Ixodes ricinus TaxID=34613 RepID=V5H7F8_IXORI